MLCSSFKGVLPSELFEKYDCEDGMLKMEYDMMIASEISERISEQMEEAKGKIDANKAVARRNQRRADRPMISPKEMGETLSGWLNDG